MKALRVGIVGCGRMGRERASACATLGHHVALVHDADPARALELQMSCPASQLAGTFLEEEWRTLDAVFLCTPPAGREQFVRSFLRIRVPFFVEKPVGVSADGGEPIVL